MCDMSHTILLIEWTQNSILLLPIWPETVLRGHMLQYRNAEYTRRVRGKTTVDVPHWLIPSSGCRPASTSPRNKFVSLPWMSAVARAAPVAACVLIEETGAYGGANTVAVAAGEMDMNEFCVHSKRGMAGYIPSKFWSRLPRNRVTCCCRACFHTKLANPSHVVDMLILLHVLHHLI